MMTRAVAVSATGRMGPVVYQAVKDVESPELVARLDVGDAPDAEHLAGADVAVDFIVLSVTKTSVHALLDTGVDVVVGITDWTEESYRHARERLARPEVAGRSALVVPNFALFAVLVMSLATKVTPYLESAEATKLRHLNKINAPSSTAVTTAQDIAAARAEAGLGAMPDTTQTDPDGARGVVVDGVHIHAARLRGLTAHEEVALGNPGEQLITRVDSFDRASFMLGTVLAVWQVSSHPGLIIGLGALLDL